MPFDPMTWTDTEFLSASALNNDLYAYQGTYLNPNGIRFHARRPLYKSFTNIVGNNITAGNWGRFYFNGNNSAGITADSGAIYGAPFDKNFNAQIKANVAGAGGGNLNGSPNRANGGIYLMSMFAPCLSNASAVGSGLGPQPIGGSPSVTGSRQAGNGAHAVTPFCLDIVDGASQTWTPYVENGDTTSQLSPFQNVPITDGSGVSGKFAAQWLSVYTAYGATVGAAPNPLPSWTGQNINAALLNGNQGIQEVLRFFNQPPFFRIVDPVTTQSLSANTAASITFTGITPTYDPYSGWTGNTYTVPFSGLYLVHGVVGFQNFSGQCVAGVQINGTNYFGPGAQMPTTNQGTATKTQIYSLNAGDTVKLIAETTSGIALSTTYPPRLCVMFLCGQGAPATLPTPPDTTYRWAAGQPGDLSSALNAHLANDLLFLWQKPYLMAYQTSGQSGIAMGAHTNLQFDTISGLIHGDNGDNYSGWNSGTNTYRAQRSGWYLAVTENSMIFPTLTTTPVVSAEFTVSPNNAANNWDSYQQINCAKAGFHPGATGVGYYYLRAGDTIKAGMETVDSSSSTVSTATGSGATSHFELVWIGE